jgi:hypothetical protein
LSFSKVLLPLLAVPPALTPTPASTSTSTSASASASASASIFVCFYCSRSELSFLSLFFKINTKNLFTKNKI